MAGLLSYPFSAECQVFVSIEVIRYADTVKVGQRTLVLEVRLSPMRDPYYCEIDSEHTSVVGVSQEWSAVSDLWKNALDLKYFLTPAKSGLITGDALYEVVVKPARGCVSGRFNVSLSAYAIADSLAMVKPQMTTNEILMHHSGPSIIANITLAKSKFVRLLIYDLTGRIVRTLERECPEGPNELSIDGSSLPPGPYYYVARAGEWMRSGKLIKLAE
jgi:hypothetical protein